MKAGKKIITEGDLEVGTGHEVESFHVKSHLRLHVLKVFVCCRFRIGSLWFASRKTAHIHPPGRLITSTLCRKASLRSLCVRRGFLSSLRSLSSSSFKFGFCYQPIPAYRACCL